MTKFKQFLSKFNIFDYIFLPVALIAATVVSIVFKADALSTVYSIVGILSLFLMSKGFFFAYFMVLVSYLLYTIQSYLNGLYGEAIINLFIGIPLIIYAIIKGLMKKNKYNDDKVVMKKIKPFEWCLCFLVVAAICVGTYFMLQAFNTKYLILSTINFGLCILANYLLARGNFANYICFLISNLLVITMWLLPILLEEPSGTNFVPIIVAFVTYICINVYGLINWIKLSKKQKEKNNGIISASGQL